MKCFLKVLYMSQHMLTKPAPYLFNGIEFGRIGRELDQAEIGEVIRTFHGMPSGAVHDHHRMTTRLCSCCNQCQVLLHHLPVYQRTEQGFRCPGCRADGTEEIDVLELLLLNSSGATATPGPQSGSRILLTKPGFVLKPDIDIGKRNMTRDVKDRFQLEVF